MKFGMLVHHFEVIIWLFIFKFFKIIWTGTNLIFFHYGLAYKNEAI